MVDLNSMLDISIGSDLYYFSTKIFEQKTKRAIWMNLEPQEAKLRWLKY